MKALPLTSQKIWPMLKFFADRQTDRRTGQKLYAPDLSIQGHKDVKVYRQTIDNQKSSLEL
jgi:hypothetical protein